jgi:hypothetical protein
MSEDAACEVFAKGLADIGLGGVVVARPSNWPTLANSNQVSKCSAMVWYSSVLLQAGTGCRAWVWSPLAHPRESALALGVRWRAWGSASVGSFTACKANNRARQTLLN